MQSSKRYLKNILSLSILLVFLGLNTPSLQAQEVRKGLVFGLNVSGITGIQGGLNMPGITAGAFMTFKVTDWMEFQPEILFDKMGMNIISNAGFADSNPRLNYFNFPLIFNFKLPLRIGSNDRALGLQVGPKPGILLSAKERTTGQNSTMFFRDFDFQITTGLALYFTQNLGITTRYAFGVPTVFKGLLGGGLFSEYTNHNLHFSLRWRFQ